MAVAAFKDAACARCSRWLGASRPLDAYRRVTSLYVEFRGTAETLSQFIVLDGDVITPPPAAPPSDGFVMLEEEEQKKNKVRK